MFQIPEEELVLKFSRSGGPGGQNVNKVNTRVTVLFDIKNSGAFSANQKRQIAAKLSSRISKDGFIKVASQKYRTQARNRAAAIERLDDLLAEALKRRAARKKTKVPGYAKEKRLEQKRQRSALKRQRTQKEFE